MERKIKRLTLEMSLKPFKEITDDYVKATVTELFHLWRFMIKRSESISMLLWVADGSEILTWKGDESERMEWAKYVGFANIKNCTFLKSSDELIGAKNYIPNPPDITYGDLKRIIRIIKQTIFEMYGIQAEVGATFDPGPEFAYSDFKYKDHPEVNHSNITSGFLPTKADYEVVCPWSVLRGDTARYATYPSGIPDGTRFGTFFGKQAMDYMENMGFDYIWFSNGFGFSYYPWTYHGANFDGERFGQGEYREMADRLLDFWEDFKRESPKRVEVRGSNFSTGMEISKDCIPVKEIYDRNYIDWPAPNSPWGYLDYNFGVELGGFLTRISYSPSRDFPFRFYLDDPWFWQICWKHGYERRPHEIFCPLSISRIDEDGKVYGPNIVEILSVDGERGVFDEQNTLEVVPTLRRALDEIPDQPGVLTMLYAFSEHHKFAEQSNGFQPVIFFNDWIICNAINNGLPLNTVVNTDVFKKIYKNELFNKTILLVPTSPFDEDYYVLLKEYVEDGGKLLFYGSVENDVLKALLNLSSAQALTGEFELETFIAGDELVIGKESSKLKHEALVSAGGISEVVKDNWDKATKVCAIVKQQGQERVYALTRKCREWKDGMVGWVRGTLPFETKGVSKLPTRFSEEYADGSNLTRWILKEFGVTVLQKRYDKAARASLTLISRSDNAYYFSGYKFDGTEQSTFGFPEGAPVMVATSAYIKDGCASYVFEKAFHHEARIFVKQENPGVVTCRHSAGMRPTEKKCKTCSLEIFGLNNAAITLYPPRKAIEEGLVEASIYDNDSSVLVPMEISYQPMDESIVMEHITGQLEVSW